MNRVFTFLRGLAGLLALLLCPGTTPGQTLNNPAEAVSNVRVELDTQRVKITYDAPGLAGPDSVFVRVESRSDGLLNPRTVTGDVGKGVMPGRDKTIFWDYRLDGLLLADSIRVTVSVKRVPVEVQRKIGGGGPANALLSALLPGVGSIFVQPTRKIGLRPLITAAYGGLLIYGLVQRSQSREAFNRYGSGLSESDYTDANQRHHRYLLTTRAAAVLWLSDVVYTFLKGQKNEQQKRISLQRVAIDSAFGTPTVGVQLGF